ncbi:hypothetical protein HPB47_026688 [Ixodes persulcatus]|uniref:Uncharacterized protein n=1 Tax=Ixodes persulcatus TaxID=34615 RepID=A0AC60PY08_IXOPE|nr:hypothetical protein HPB47_026688 [Ixodes persulcatus]
MRQQRGVIVAGVQSARFINFGPNFTFDEFRATSPGTIKKRPFHESPYPAPHELLGAKTPRSPPPPPPAATRSRRCSRASAAGASARSERIPAAASLGVGAAWPEGAHRGLRAGRGKREGLVCRSPGHGAPGLLAAPLPAAARSATLTPPPLPCLAPPGLPSRTLTPVVSLSLVRGGARPATVHGHGRPQCADARRRRR